MPRLLICINCAPSGNNLVPKVEVRKVLKVKAEVRKLTPNILNIHPCQVVDAFSHLEHCKAALCTLWIIKKVPDLAENSINAAAALLKEKHHGVLIAGAQLCTDMCRVSTEPHEHFRKASFILYFISDCSGFCMLGQGDADASDAMTDVLAQESNATLHECVATIMSIEDNGGLRVLAVNILGKFLSSRDNNIKYVALNMLMKAISLDSQAVQRHLERVKLVEILELGSHGSQSFNIDPIFVRVFQDGNYVKDEVWHALIVVITNAPNLHGYTVRSIFKAVQKSREQVTPVRVAVWCIGEYGEMLISNAGLLDAEDPITVAEAETVDLVETASRFESVTMLKKMKIRVSKFRFFSASVATAALFCPFSTTLLYCLQLLSANTAAQFCVICYCCSILLRLYLLNSAPVLLSATVICLQLPPIETTIKAPSSSSTTDATSVAAFVVSPVTDTGVVKPTTHITLDNVLFAPNFPDLQTKRTIGRGHERGGLYYLDPISPVSPSALSAAVSPYQWHCHLDHPSSSSLRSLVQVASVDFNYVARTLISHMHVPKYLWSDAVLTACFLINMMPSSVLHGDIPFSCLYTTSSTCNSPEAPETVPTVSCPLPQSSSPPASEDPPPSDELPIAIRKVIPTSYQEALKHPLWRAAMDEEMRALLSRGTWILVHAPDSVDIVSCRWVFIIKCLADGSINLYKARLVAKGYTQTYGIDYFETFSPTTRMNSIRILFSLAINLSWPMYQRDVKNAFLYGDLTLTVFMEQPPGYVAQGEDATKVCCLKKAIYGLKQSPKAWFDKFSSVLGTIGFKSSAEAEYRAMAHTAIEMIGVKNLLGELRFTFNEPLPMHYCIVKAIKSISFMCKHYEVVDRFVIYCRRIKDTVLHQKGSLVLELQQRAIEFNSIIEKHEKIRSALVERMPVLDEATYSGRRAAPLIDLLDLNSDDVQAPSSSGGDFLHDLLGVDLSPASLGTNSQAPKNGTDVLLDLLSVGALTAKSSSSMLDVLSSEQDNKRSEGLLDNFASLSTSSARSSSAFASSSMMDLMDGFGPSLSVPGIPASGNTLPASGNGSIAQKLKVSNSQQGKVTIALAVDIWKDAIVLSEYRVKSQVLRVRINYKANGKDILEDGQISNFLVGCAVEPGFHERAGKQLLRHIVMAEIGVC
ncbi:hypothetical protein SASPL_119199 [Salvia splendens]|uniref:Uncharacterized protein n=1 Tax=Salvia splendens TaxID=180675 RepID=A0A8X8XZ65_SALSN|nr:hypothetical protein SASPL_119199 [Salvia splendens]